MGVGGALVVGGAVSGFLANSKRSDVEDECRDFECPEDFDLDGTRDSAKTLALVADILFIAGGAAIVGGLITALVGGGSESADAPSASIGCSHQGCMASVSGQL